MTSPIRGVAYYRMSTAAQEQSIPEQKSWARSASPKASIELVREFEDPGIPGSEIEQRPGLMALLDFCERENERKRPIAAVVVWDLDRFSRASSIRTAAVLDRLMQAGVRRIFTPEGWIDLEDDAAVLMLNVKQDFSRAAFSKAIGKNVTRAAAERAAKGWLVAGRAPYGYRPVYVTTRDKAGKERRTPTTLEIGDPAEAEAVRWMFVQYATTADSIGDITRKLGESAAPPPRARRRKDGSAWGGEWKRHTVYAILTSLQYTGAAVWNANPQGKYYEHAAGGARQVKGGGRRRFSCSEEGDRIIVPDAHPAVVDRETFDAVQKKLAASRWTKDRHSGRRGDWVLSGLVYCGGCGGRMVGHTQNHHRGEKTYTYRKYICRTNFRSGANRCRSCAAEQGMLVREVARIIKATFTDPAKLAMLCADLDQITRADKKGAAKERAALRRRLAELERAIPDGARRLLLCPEEHMADASESLRALKAEREDVTRRLEKLDAAAEAGDDYTAAVQGAVAQLHGIEEAVAEATPDELRTLITRWVSKVTLHFKPPKIRKDGRSINVLSEVEIDFTPETLHLLPSEATRRC